LRHSVFDAGSCSGTAASGHNDRLYQPKGYFNEAAMTFEDRLISKFRDRGILIDTNILLLYLVGTYDPRRIVSSRRLRSNGYNEDDFALLKSLVARFHSCVTTPFILTEAYALLNHDDAIREGSLRASIEIIPRLKESQPQSRKICINPKYLEFGITDSAIIEIGPNYLVLTDDMPLWNYLQHVGITSLNFTQLRGKEWLNS
ncbi:MAG: hypothetical protein ACRDF4_03055, partial [Rhabdochlamydiaceae bacterium]